ncbi:hypothetical protein JEQ12_014101 [Ovis aries]|uniref:ALMS motif domain-containing protein n=1 Tax=Ovis aries TaxID=9940 RepID=A0A836D7I0_SHEEP|nr:hypothetical protein JEQ12_014101 [Ovis aries]
MEPEDLPWPGELEEEEEEEGAENLDEDEVVMVEEMEEEERREPEADFNYESQRRESTDDEDDEEAKAWLQAQPSAALPQASLPRHRYSESELTSPGKVLPLTCHLWQQPLYQNDSGTQISDTNVASLEKIAPWGSGDDQRTESWHCLPQEMDSSCTLDTAQTGFNMREKGTEVTDFTSLEEGILTQSENQGKDPNRDLLCSPLLDFYFQKLKKMQPAQILQLTFVKVLQDNFASPDLPLLTCLTERQEFGPDSLFHQSELDFAPLRGIPGKSEDTEWFSRPSEVSEALFQAASGVASDLVNSCFSISQHPLIGSTAVKSQHSLLTPEQGTKEETVSSNTLDDQKTCERSGNYDAVYSYMSWETQEVMQEPATNLADKDQVSFSTASDISDEYINPKGSDSFDASYLYAQYGNQGTLQQSEKYLASKDHDAYSDSSDTIDRNKIPKESDNFSFSNMPWSKQGASHHPEIYLISKDRVSFPHEVAPYFNNKMPHSFWHCLLGSGGSEVPLMSDSHYFESVCLRAPVENEVKQKVESYKSNEDLGKGLSQCCELKENRNTLMFSEVHPRSSEIQYVENVIVPDNSVEVSEAHILSRGLDTSTMEISGGPLQTIKSNSNETSEQLYFQEERNQEATSVFDGKNVGATKNVAFQAVIASIEPSKKESTVNEIQTDINKSLTNDSRESEPKRPDPSLLNYDESLFLDKLNHPRYQSTPAVFESGASKPLYKKDDGDSSLYWHHNLKSIPSAPQEILIKPLSVSPELKSSSSLSEKSLRQAVGLGKTWSTLFQYGIDNEQFLPIGKIKSVSALDLAERLGPSNIIYPMKVWTSDSLVSQDLKQHTFEEVADSSNCILGKTVNSSYIIEGPSAAVGSSFSANLVACDAKLQGALPVISNAPLIAVGQKTLLKADMGRGEMPRPLGAKCSFTIHTIMQNDSYFIEGLQGKAESDICTLEDDTECCSIDENAVVCSKRQQICDQGDLTGECVELTGLENLLDDLEVCDSSLQWQSTVQLPSKEDSSFEDSVCPSNTDINESFSSVLPPFVPREPARDLEYHSSNLRMLRVSPDTASRTVRHLTGDTSKGGTAEIPQSTFKPGITTFPEDSDTVSLLSLSPEDFPQLAGRSPQVKNIGGYTDTLNQQTLVDSRLTEETLKISAIPGLADQKTGIAAVSSSLYSQREKPNIFYPQALPDSHLTEEALKAGAVPGLGDQKTGLSTVPPSSYLLGEKHSIFYPQALPDSHQTEESLNVSVLPGLVDQKTGKPIVPASSYSVGEEPGIFYHQVLPDSQLPEEALKVLASPIPVDQKSGLPTLSSTYSYGEKPHIFYQQTLPDSHPTEQTLKVSAAPGLAEQKTGVPTVTSPSYSNKEKPSIFYQPELPNRRLIQEAHQVSAAPGLAEQKTGVPTVTSPSYSNKEKPSIFYQPELPNRRLIQEAHQVSAAPGLVEQKAGISIVPSTSYSQREKPNVVYQQELPDSHLIQEVQQVSAVPGLAEQKTGIPAIPSASYSHREKPSIVYQQELSDSQLIEQSQKVSSVPGLAEQKTGIPTVPSASYSHREKSSIFYQQELPDSHLIQEVQQVSTAAGPLEQKTGIPTVPSTSYSHREKSSIFYQQELPDSHLIQEVQQVSAAAGPFEQKTGIPTVPSTSYSHREKPHIFYQQELPESHVTEQAQKVSSVPGLAEQKTGISTVASASYSHREKPSILYQQELPDVHVIHEVPEVSSVPGLAEQKARIPVIPSTSYSHREKPSILYQQELPDSHLTEQVQKASAAPGPAEQKIGIPIITSASYLHREKPVIFYQQDLPDSHLTKEAQKVPAVSGLAHQKSGIPIVPPAFYSHGGKTSLFYQQELPDSHLSDQTQNISAIPGPVDQNTGIQTAPSTSYSYREKPITFYQQELPGRLLTEEVLKVSALPRTDQNTGIITGSSRSYLFGEKPSGLFYQQVLPDGSLTEEALKVSPASRPSDQKTGVLLLPASSYSHREKPGIFYPQASPSSHLFEETLKDSTVLGPADQKAGTSEPSGSYSHREESSIFYQQELPDSHITGEALKISGVSGTGDQKTGIPIVTSPSYSQKEKPIVFYQQISPDSYLPEEALNVSNTPSQADQKTGIPIVTSPSFSYNEKPIIFYQQALPDSQLTVEALKVSDVPGPSDQKTGIPTVPPSSYSYGEKPVISYQQESPDLTQVALKVFEVPGPADQKIGIPPVTSTSYSYGEKPIISYQQELPDANENALKGLGVPRQADQTIGVRIVPPASYSHRESPIFSYQQELPDLTEEALKVFALPGPPDQNAEIPIGPSSSYSHKEKLKILPDSQKTELPLTPSGSYSHREKPKTSTVIGPADQKAPLLTGFPNSYPQRVKPSIFLQQQLADRHQSGDILKISPVAEPTDVNSRIPIPLSSSHSHREKSNIFYPQELPDKHLREDSLKVSTVPGPADKKTVLPVVPPSSFSHREKPAILYHQDFPERHLTEDNLKFSSSLGQADQMTGLSTGPPGTYSHSEKHKLVSHHVQRLTDNLDSSHTSVISNNMTLNSQADGRVVINKPESSGFEDVGSEEMRDTENSSKTLKEIQTLLMEAENIALRRYNFPTPLVPFRNVSDISFIQSKKMVCFKEPLTTDESNAWNLKYNMAHEYGYSISELNEDDRRKVEEIKAKLFGQGRTTDLSKDLQSPRGIGCKPEAVCSHIIIESHEKGCFRTLTAERPRLDSHPCVFRSAEPSEIVRGQWSPSSWRTRHINLSKSLDQNNSQFKVWNSLQLQSHSPFQNFISDDLEISKGLRMPFHEKLDPWLSELVEPACMPPEEMDCHSSSQMLPPEPMKKFTTSITFSSHRHSKCFSDSSFLKVGVTEGSQCSGASVGVVNSHFTEEQNPPRDLKQRTSSPSSLKIISQSPDKAVTILAENSSQSQKLSVEHSYQEEKPLEKSDFKSSHPKPSASANDSNFKEVHFSDNHTLISMGRPNSTVEVKEKNVTITADVEAKFSDVVSPSAPNQCTVATSVSSPPSNRKALSCIRITLSPKTPSKLDSGNLDKRLHSLEPATKTRMNSEFNSDLQTISSRSLEPTSKLLISKPVAQNQESLGFLGPKSSSDFQVVQSPLPDSNVITQDLKTIPYQNSQIVTSRQTQVNSSDLEEYSNPEGTPVSADRSPEEIKTLFSPSSGKLSSDAVTQITTESPGKATFSSEIFVNAEDHGREIPELSTQKLGNVPVKFASSSSVQQITVPHGTDGQPLLLPYKPSGSTKMYYVPQLTQIPSSTDSKSDTTIESSHSGSNDAIAPDFPAQVLGTRDDDLADTVNIKHKEGIYSKRAVTKASLSMGKKPFQKDNADAQVLITGDEDLSDKNQEKEIYTKKAVTKIAYSEEKESLQKDATGSSTAAASQHSTQLQDTKTDIKQKEEIHSKRKVTKEAWSEEKKSLQIDIAESKCHSEFENTTHSVFRSAKFYFHHPVHLSSDQDFCHESLGRSVFMKHSWKDFFQHHPDKQREYACLPSPCQHMEKTKTDYTRIQSLSINVNLENKELKHASKSQARDFPKSDKQINDLKRDPKATPELTTEHTVSLNELWNRYQERQKQQKPEFSAKKELSLVERLDRLAKLLQHPITHSLQPSESTQDDSRGEQDVKEWGDKQQQQKNKLQKKKQYKSLEKCHKNTDSRQSEDSELLTDTATNILSTTTSPVESDILTQTDKEMTLQERSSSISTIDTARLIHAFGHERVCLSPRRIKLYSSITDHQRRYLEKRSKKNKKALNTGYPQITSEHTRRKHIQVTDHVSSDSVSSSTSSFWSSNSTLCNKQNAHMLNKGVQAGNLEIVSGVRKNTRDVGMTFPTPSSSEARMEEDSDVTSWSEEKIEEKRLLTSYLVDKKLKKNKKSCCEGVSWFVPVENMKSGPKKENMPKLHGPGVSWFAPITNTKPWREPLREQNWQGRHMDSHSSPAGPGKELLKPFVRATLQESLQLHRPDFISRSGERIKRLKLIVQERKLQNMLQTEREALFNAVQEWQGYRDPMYLLHKRGFLAAQKKRPIGKKEMIQRSKRVGFLTGSAPTMPTTCPFDSATQKQEPLSLRPESSSTGSVHKVLQSWIAQQSAKQNRVQRSSRNPSTGSRFPDKQKGRQRKKRKGELQQVA